MQKQDASILIIDDDRDVQQAARLLLKGYFSEIETAAHPQEAIPLIKQNPYDVILLDMNFARGKQTGEEGLYWLKQIKSEDADVAVILITAFGDVNLAIQAIREGATDFVLKPWVNEKLVATVASACELRRTRQQLDRMRNGRDLLQSDMQRHFGEMIGQSEEMRHVFRLMEKVAATDANVLILGENGTGKEVVARSLHTMSGRAQEPFVAVDMGAITETLFESELFGHVKGAFTDARDNRAGRFEIASGGTLFLDEIGNIPMAGQAKLLNVLQSRKLVRVGSNREISFDVRLICATNSNIHEMVQQKRFRQDLLYRINTIEIQLPPLRQRIGDIPLLARHYAETYGRKYGKGPMSLSATALKKLEAYTWPGNVRELQHAIERAVILSAGSTLQAEDFLLTQSSRKDREQLVFDNYNLENAERMLILGALDKAQGNISKAAAHLGLTRAALYRRIEKYGL